MSESMKVEIFMPCPICINEGRNSASEYWRHGSEGGLSSIMLKPCNGILCLDDRANIICSKCGKTRHLQDVKLTCNSGRHKFAIAPQNSKTSYAAAISTASQFTNAGGINYLISVMKYLK